MITSRYLAMELVDTERFPAASLEHTGLLDPWCADGSVEESEAIGRRNRGICERLKAVIPGARSADDVEEFDEFLDGDLSQEAALRRLHRSRAVSAGWRGGQIDIRLFDRVAWVSLPVTDLTRAERPEFSSALAESLQQICAITGMQPRDVLTGNVTSVPLAVASLLKKNARALDQLAGQVSRFRWQLRLGPLSVAILCLFAMVLSAGILASAVERGHLMLHVEPASPQTFVTETMPPPVYRWGVFPKYFLEGRVGDANQWVRLPVYRNEYLRAGPGAPFTVLPTWREGTPYVLRSDFDSAGPQLRAGGFGLAWFAAIALLPLFLAYWVVARPILRSPAQLRAYRVAGATRMLTRLLMIAGVFFVAIWVRMHF